MRRTSLDLPGGSIKSDAGEILLRTKGQAYRGQDFEKLVLLSRRDGTRLTLGDVAPVVDGFEETDQSARFDGQPAVLVKVLPRRRTERPAPRCRRARLRRAIARRGSRRESS